MKKIIAPLLVALLALNTALADGFVGSTVGNISASNAVIGNATINNANISRAVITNLAALNLVTNGIVTIQQDMVVGQLNVNTYGYPIMLSGVQGVLSNAAVAGKTALILKVNTTTNIVLSFGTAAAMPANETGRQTNGIATYIIPTNAVYGFLDVSSGTGNAAYTAGGQISYMPSLIPRSDQTFLADVPLVFNDANGDPTTQVIYTNQLPANFLAKNGDEAVITIFVTDIVCDGGSQWQLILWPNQARLDVAGSGFENFAGQTGPISVRIKRLNNDEFIMDMGDANQNYVPGIEGTFDHPLPFSVVLTSNLPGKLAGPGADFNGFELYTATVRFYPAP